MEMDIKALSEKLSEHQFEHNAALNNGARISEQTAITKNILYNNFDAIVEALKYAADVEGKIKLLELELNDAERELDEKDKRIRELSAAKKTTGKRHGGGSGE